MTEKKESNLCPKDILGLKRKKLKWRKKNKQKTKKNREIKNENKI